MPKGIYVRNPASYAPQTVSEPIEETRQEYVNRRIREIQPRIVGHPADCWPTLLELFRRLGDEYDRGYRLRGKELAA